MISGRVWDGCKSGKGASADGDVVGGVGIEVDCECEGIVTVMVGD